MPNIQVQEDLICTERLSDGGWRWTLVSRLGEMLDRAQERFGDRKSAVKFLGLEFCDDGPNITPLWGQYVAVRLRKECLTDFRHAIHQLSHECVHLLSHTLGVSATNLEEGLAVDFQAECLKRICNVDMCPPAIDSYNRAWIAAKELLSFEADAVRKMRLHQPIISLIDAELIKTVVPAIAPQTAEFLAQLFVR